MTIEELTVKVQKLEDIIADLSYSDKFIFQKHIQMMDGKDFQFARGTGTKFGTGTDQKIGFYDKTPVAQQGAITSPSGGATVDTQARTAIDAIRTVLINLGLTA